MGEARKPSTQGQQYVEASEVASSAGVQRKSLQPPSLSTRNGSRLAARILDSREESDASWNWKWAYVPDPRVETAETA